MTYIKVIAYLKKSTHITHIHTHTLACTRVCVCILKIMFCKVSFKYLI